MVLKQTAPCNKKHKGNYLQTHSQSGKIFPLDANNILLVASIVGIAPFCFITEFQKPQNTQYSTLEVLDLVLSFLAVNMIHLKAYSLM